MNMIQSLSVLVIAQFSGKIKADEHSVMHALKSLLPVDGNDIDIGALIERIAMNGGNVVSLAISWLSDDSNQTLRADQLSSLLGEQKISAFSRALGLNKNEAANALASIIPQLIDQNSQGGVLYL